MALIFNNIQLIFYEKLTNNPMISSKFSNNKTLQIKTDIIVIL